MTTSWNRDLAGSDDTSFIAKWLDSLTMRLGRVSARQRAAFAASCATRLLPAYSIFARIAHWGSDIPFSRAIDVAWTFAAGVPTTSVSVAYLAHACESQLPGEDLVATPITEAATDAGVAAIKALEACRSNAVSPSVEAARMVINVVDAYVGLRAMAQVGITLGTKPKLEPEEMRFAQREIRRLASEEPHVRTEITRQEADLCLVERHDWLSNLEGLRRRADQSELSDLIMAMAAMSTGAP